MLCTYRYYVRPDRFAGRPKKTLSVKRDEAIVIAPPPPESASPIVTADMPPHETIVRQYAW